jgi:glutamyl-tRNA synthetase
VARAASAPHGPADEGPRYPGTCRTLPPADVEARAREAGRRPTIRFAGRGEPIAFRDEVRGAVEPLGADGLDDFVLRRADGVAAYQLAVVVDDAAMEIEEIVRGDDLLSSTPRQIALYRALGWTPPRFAHVPLLLDEGGERLAKRTRPPTLASLRAAAVPPEDVVGRLARSAGLWAPEAGANPRTILDALGAEPPWDRLHRAPAVWRR